MAAVDCLNEEELCEDEFGVTNIPEVWAFPANSDLDAERFTGEFKENDLANFAVKFMESFVQYVSSSNYQDFVKNDIFKVLLFTNKKSTPPLLKALSKDFKDKLVFGEVRNLSDNLVK